jgi:hypothetical protein
VRTGHGREAEMSCKEAGIRLDHVANNLMEAVTWLVSKD